MSPDMTQTPAEPAVLNDPLRNRGVAFTLAEREALGLTGRLPSGVLTRGLGLGTIVSGASQVTDGMPRAAAGQADVSAPGASLLPAVGNLRASSATAAVAVAGAAADDGVATRKADDLVQAVQDAIGQPVYPDSVS